MFFANIGTFGSGSVMITLIKKIYLSVLLKLIKVYFSQMRLCNCCTIAIWLPVA